MTQTLYGSGGEDLGDVQGVCMGWVHGFGRLAVQKSVCARAPAAPG